MALRSSDGRFSRRLTDADHAYIKDWYCKRLALGGQKTVAARLKIHPTRVNQIIKDLRMALKLSTI